MITLSQAYVLLRYLLSGQSSRWAKLRLIVRLLDLLERDYKAIYPDDPSPMDDSYEATLRRLLKP